MTAVKIKICGIADAAALDAAIAARADYAGLVFYARSPRAVTAAQAAALAGRAGSRIARIGLFVDADDAAIGEAVAAGKLHGLQLHGSESPERAARLRVMFGLPVWKAIAVAGADDIDRARAYEGAADLVLFDAKTPGGALPGGMGLAFDWGLLKRWKGALPWGLAGGINPDNVAEALRRTGAPLVDVSSGVESAPGKKDAAKIAAFAKAVRTP